MYHADTEQVNTQGENTPWNHHFRKENLQQGDSNRENTLEEHYSGAFICVQLIQNKSETLVPGVGVEPT
jgi:hypothetical protein